VYRISLDIGATKTVIGSMDEEGKILARVKLPSTQILEEAATPVEALAAAIRNFCQQSGFELPAVDGAVIGFPGVMDRLSKTIISCPNLPRLDGLSLGPDLAQLLQIPVLVENDVNLIALGEHFKGRGREVDDLACVFVGSGIGCGLILNGRLFVGADGIAGEIGHIVIEPNGPQCTCGNRGCLEMYCSGKGLTLQAASILGEERVEAGAYANSATPSWASAERVINAAKRGNQSALEAMKRAFHYLGLGVVNLVNILNPRLIILGGGIVSGWPEGIDIVKETVRTRARTVARDRLIIDRPILGDKAAIFGAYRLLDTV
jgi:glucokinase